MRIKESLKGGKMVTSFILEPGYAFGEENRATTAEMIQEIAKSITIEQLKAKCAEYGLIEVKCREGCKLEEFLEKYKSLPTDDLTCRFTKDGVLQSATSGTGHREETEIIRRAFGILVLNECYKRKLSVSFIIA